MLSRRGLALVAKPAIRSSFARTLFYGSASVLRQNALNAGNCGAPTFCAKGLLPASTRPSFGARTFASRLLEEPCAEVNYDEVAAIAKHPDPNSVIVDAREPDEYAAGHIPGAVNIPYRSSPGALGLDPETFEETFGFPKPSTDKTLIFYCMAGVRSTAAEQLASTYGYTKRKNYKGSYEDWLAHTEKPASHQPAQETPKHS